MDVDGGKVPGAIKALPQNLHTMLAQVQVGAHSSSDSYLLIVLPQHHTLGHHRHSAPSQMKYC